MQGQNASKCVPIGFAFAQVNAFYDPTTNGIEFPAGILAPPIYDRRAPMYINYGAIGMVIGHEMSHGFDLTGIASFICC